MHKTIKVSVNNEHIKKLTNSKTPYEPLMELLWNALDADASEVEITIHKNDALKCVESIEVLDNGHGMSSQFIDDYFGNFGDNHKEKLKQSPTGRFFHGKKGYGRYKALSICSKAVWEFYQNKLPNFRLQLTKNDPGNVDIDIDEKNNTESKYGVKVTLLDINDKFCNTLSDDEKLINKIASQFCVYLNTYKDIGSVSKVGVN